MRDVTRLLVSAARDIKINTLEHTHMPKHSCNTWPETWVERPQQAPVLLQQRRHCSIQHNKCRTWTEAPRHKLFAPRCAKPQDDILGDILYKILRVLTCADQWEEASFQQAPAAHAWHRSARAWSFAGIRSDSMAWRARLLRWAYAPVFVMCLMMTLSGHPAWGLRPTARVCRSSTPATKWLLTCGYVLNINARAHTLSSRTISCAYLRTSMYIYLVWLWRSHMQQDLKMLVLGRYVEKP